MTKVRAYITIAILAFAVIMLEFTQTRILSFIFKYHIVYLITCIALLGFGISGTLVAIAIPKYSNNLHIRHLINKLLLLFGASICLGIVTIALLPSLDAIPPALQLTCSYTVYLLPFIFAGSIISILFAGTDCHIGKLYAIDLLSASAACVLFFFLLPILGAYKLLGLIVILCTPLSFLWTNEGDKRTRLFAAAITAVGFFVLIAPIERWLPVWTEPGKWFAEYMNIRGSHVERTSWTPLCRIDVIANALETLPYYSWKLEPGALKIITQDGNAPTKLLSYRAILKSWRRIQGGEVLNPTCLAFLIKRDPEVAVIGVGGGSDVFNALGYGAGTIYGAEINPSTFRFLTHDYLDYQGHVIESSNVHLFNEEGRSMLRKLHRKVDILQIGGVHTFAALPDGAYTLSENYLYTIEAFKEFLNCLKPGGILSVARFGGIEGLRLTSLACKSLKEMGCRTIDEQVMVIATPDRKHFGFTQLLVNNQPFTKQEVQTLKLAVEAYPGWHALFYPVTSAQSAPAGASTLYKANNNSISVERNNTTELIRAFQSGTEKDYFATYPYIITPTRDDSPFFLQYGPKKPRLTLNNFPTTAMDTILVAIGQSSLFMIVAILLPLWRFSKEGIATPNAASLSIYFASLGFAFMLFELGLTQKCVLLLGDPLHALSAVLATLLLSAGLGSALVTKLNWNISKIIYVFGTLFLLAALTLTIVLSSLIYSLMHLPLFWRIMSCFCMLFPIGITMGMFFPSGLQLLRGKADRYIPWAWGINGCASVYGSFAAIYLAIEFGFTASLMIGTAVYMVAFLSGLRAAKV